jgi:diacylglycerol kinase (ATP)
MIHVIINPAAGRGRARRMRPSIEAALAQLHDVRIMETRSSGEETQLAAVAVRSGAERILIVGGDGTCSRVADVLVRAKSSSAVAVIPCGTGNDFAKTLGLGHLSVTEILGLISEGESTRIDVGSADGHLFINSCGFGFDPSVLEASNRVRFLNGDAVYIYAALRQLFTYRGIEVSANGVHGESDGRMLMVTVSNGRWLGGAFRIAPRASVLDGKLDACFVSDSNLSSRVKLFVRAMAGNHLAMPSVSSACVEELTLTFAGNPSMEMDGELRRATSRTVRIECIPKALTVIAAPGALV